jgi:hypothetical protein
VLREMLELLNGQVNGTSGDFPAPQNPKGSEAGILVRSLWVQGSVNS